MATALNQNCQGEGSSTTVVQNEISEEQVSSGVVRLRLQAKPSDQKKVKWTTDTVDNEHMNRKKSKCCCVYVRPKAFDESSSEEEDGECEHCSGHVEAKKESQEQHNEDVQPSSSQT